MSLNGQPMRTRTVSGARNLRIGSTFEFTGCRRRSAGTKERRLYSIAVRGERDVHCLFARLRCRFSRGAYLLCHRLCRVVSSLCSAFDSTRRSFDAALDTTGSNLRAVFGGLHPTFDAACGRLRPMYDRLLHLFQDSRLRGRGRTGWSSCLGGYVAHKHEQKR